MTCQKNARTTSALTFIRQVITNEIKNDGVELDKLKFLVRVCLHTKHTFPSQETTKYSSCNVQKRKKRATLVTRFLCGKGGIRTPGASQHGGFQDRCNRPLYHLSSAYCRRSFSKAMQR